MSNIQGRQTTNPYTHTLGILKTTIPDLKSRMAWDLRPIAWRSRARMRLWRDKFSSSKAVIVCNGPSLNQTDLSGMQNVYTIGLNKINLLFGRNNFRPNAIVAVNKLVIDQNADFFDTTDIPLFLDSYAASLVSERENVCFVHSVEQRKFARDCSMSINQGATVTFVALQIAFHMGFRDIALIGCDHSFASKGPANKTVIAGKTDVDHFDPNYFAGGVEWQLPDLLQSEVSYTMARDIFAAEGGRVVNATVGGKLEIFERLMLADFLQQPTFLAK
ncbi:MAG: DUF115 domain-containing protein [Cytophaga sp.]|nr:DUF115 domain-containing protein [Undibacterium sp.]